MSLEAAHDSLSDRSLTVAGFANKNIPLPELIAGPTELIVRRLTMMSENATSRSRGVTDSRRIV